MAEEKTFRYGFIMLGFFLVMTGMFIMSVEKPQIYITFCAVGVLLVAVGITWSMCQCYPRVTFVPVHPEAEWFLADKPTVPTEKDSPGKLCPQAPYSSAYEKSLPSYEQVQRQALAQPRPRSCSQPAVQAKAEVHRELGGGQDPPQEPQPHPETSSWYVVAVGGLGWGAGCPHTPVKPVRGGADVLGGGSLVPNCSPW
uniref:Barttin CLCNK type accessory subunit beta n=1 Tax=Anas platyrhynchos TaxID=8839 RepID=A0A8B9TQ04_ANAPL